MASKKIRFEVFKRDGFQCAYCGKSPPTVILEVDHIEPKSKGGKDDINNYITACFNCNRGKSNIPLDKVPLKIEDNIRILKAKEEQLQEYRKFIQKIERRIKREIKQIDEIYSDQYDGWCFSEKFKNTSLRKFLQLLPKEEIIESLYIAILKFPVDQDRVINYFCGVCWRKIKGCGGEE